MYIPISKRQEDITQIPQRGYVPISQRGGVVAQPTQPVFSAPKYDFGLITPNTTAMSTPSIYGGGTIQSGVGGFAKGIGQSVARNIASMGISVANKLEQDRIFAESGGKIKRENIPIQIDTASSDSIKNLFGQALFETIFTKEPIKSVETRIAEAEPEIVKWQSELADLSKNPNLSWTEKKVVDTLANLKPNQLAFTGIMGSVGLDMTPFGGLEKNAWKTMVKTATRDEALILLKRMGVAEDLALNFADDVVKVSTEKEAQKLFNHIADFQLKTKPSAYVPITERIATTDIQGNKVEQIFARKATALEIKSPTAKSRGYNSIPDKDGYEKVFKPYGENGAGYYYNKILPKETTTEPLIQEAKKYKTAEEFVKAQTPSKDYVTVYHRTDSPVESFGKGGIFSKENRNEFFVSNKKLGQNEGYGKNVIEMRVKKSDLSINDEFPSGEKHYTIDTKKADEYLQTKSQLTDIWKKANKKQLPTPEGLPKITPKDKLGMMATEIEIRKEALQGMEGKQLVKYKSKTTGELPELTGQTSMKSLTGSGKTVKTSEFGQRGDEIIQEIFGYEKSPDRAMAQTALEKYQNSKKALMSLQKEYQIAKKELRTKEILDGMAKRMEKHLEDMRKFEKDYPKLFKATLTMSEEATKGAKVGYRVGKVVARDEILTKLRVTTEATQDIKDSIIEYAKNNLPIGDRGKALVMIRDAKTQKDLTKAFSRINNWAEEIEKKSVRNEILKKQRAIMDSPSIAIDYKAKIKEVLDDFELKGHTKETMDRLQSTRDFLAKESLKGNDVEIPRRVLKSLETLNRTSFEQVTTSQLKGALAEIELLEEIGKTKLRTQQNLFKIQKEKIIKEIEIQGATPLNTNKLIRPEIGERLTMSQKARNLVIRAQNQASRIDKVITPMDAIFDLLDGGKGSYDGANFRFFKGQVDAGYGRYLNRKDVLQNPVIELSNKYKLNETNFERMGVVAAREQENGIDKLIASGFSEKEIDAVVLTSQEREVLDLMRKIFDSQFPEIQDIMRRVYNQPVEKVKNYFSFMTDWKAMDESEVFQRFGSQAPEQYGTPRKNIEAGFTKSRVGGGQKIKVNALDVFLQHTDNTSYLLELGETSKTLGEIAASPEYAQLVGDAGQLMIREWVDVVARKGGASGATTIPMLDVLRKNVGAGILGMKLSTVVIQPTSLIDGMGFIGVPYTLRGVKNFATDSAWRKFIINMPEIKDRMGGEFALRELTDDNWFQKVQRKGFVPMQAMDRMTAGMVAGGAYIRKLDELGIAFDATKYNPEALAYAQLAVRRTQSSGAFKDVPLAISRGALSGNRSFDRAVFQFQNFLLNRWSRVRHDAIRAGINTKNPKNAVGILAFLAMTAVAASGIRLGANRLVDFVTGDEDEMDATDRLTQGIVYEATGNIPFIGTAVSMWNYDAEMFPILDAPKKLIDGLRRALFSKSQSAKLRGLTDFTTSLGEMAGIPGSTQVEQLIKGKINASEPAPKSKTKVLKTPAGLPKLPSLKSTLPKLPKLPKL